MLALEVKVNGRRAYVAGGQSGISQFSLTANDQNSADGLPIAMATQIHSPDTIFLWSPRELKVGDTVTVRIMESEDYDPADIVLPKVKKVAIE